MPYIKTFDRTIFSGIHAFYEPEELVGKTLVRKFNKSIIRVEKNILIEQIRGIYRCRHGITK